MKKWGSNLNLVPGIGLALNGPGQGTRDGVLHWGPRWLSANLVKNPTKMLILRFCTFRSVEASLKKYV